MSSARNLTLLCMLCSCSALNIEPVLSSRRAILTTVLPATLFAPLSASVEDQVLHIMNYPKQGLCGEALVPEKAAPFVRAFGGFSDGSCAAFGYTVKEGSANGTGDKDKERSYDLYSKED